MTRVISRPALAFAIIACTSPVHAVDPLALGEPLKNAYPFGMTGKFYQTGEVVDGYSIICEMGQAVPSSERDDWYVNRPIPGLALELQARAAIVHQDGTVKTLGHVAVIKNGDPLKVFDPIGDWVSGEWDGDLLSSWPVDRPEIRLFSQRLGVDGYAHFNLMDGMGFYYDYRDQEEPAYFLSDCRRIKKTGLPVYDWDFTQSLESLDNMK